MTIQQNIVAIKKAIHVYEQTYDRAKDSVQLLVASKGRSVEQILAAIQAGQHLFGESYLQEALVKIQALANQSIEWHFIGPIQSNKTRKIAEHFSWVHSVDSMKIARRLNDQRPLHLPPLNICIEVNTSHETTKSGITVEEVPALAQYCLSLQRLKLRGLMTIPAPKPDVPKQRVAFHTLFTLWQSLRTQGMLVDTLSMGMSEDFEAAIAEGSTIVRIGTAIFKPIIP